MYKVQIKGLRELQQKLGASDAIIAEEMGKATKQAVIVVEGEVRKLTPVGVSSLLRNTVNHEVRETGGRIVGAVGSGISEKEKYPWVVEFGRKPGARPPIEEGKGLMLWVQRKIRPGKDELYLVTRRIAHAIARRGTRPVGMFEKGWDKSEERVVGLFEAALRRVVERL